VFHAKAIAIVAVPILARCANFRGKMETKIGKGAPTPYVATEILSIGRTWIHSVNVHTHITLLALLAGPVAALGLQSYPAEPNEGRLREKRAVGEFPGK
jgi:hypothetical protein